MDRMLYVSMTGTRQIELAQAANTHNLANVNTTGFRADLFQFRSMPVQGAGVPSRVYAMTERPAVDFAPGPINATGRDLDMAVQGRGWIAVQAPDGSETYTRAGNLRLTPEGMLITGAGHPVLGDSGPIAVPPAEKIEIGADGTVSVRPIGQGAATLAAVGRIKLVNPSVEQLTKGGDGLMRLPAGEVAMPDAQVQLVSGALEGSNVNAVDALVHMIELARQFEMQVKMMHTAEETDGSSTKLLSMG